jgi:hypothetical protein
MRLMWTKPHPAANIDDSEKALTAICGIYVANPTEARLNKAMDPNAIASRDLIVSTATLPVPEGPIEEVSNAPGIRVDVHAHQATIRTSIRVLDMLF